MDNNLLKLIYERAALCRAFEEECYRRVQSGDIKFPVYLSAGQEYISATISVLTDEWGSERQVFIQHRGHSVYLCFGGDLDALVLELLGDSRGCAGGMGGSASIQSKAANICGHDGLMGTQVPIAVGACYANRKPTICFLGDAAAEEDYVLTALGWAATHKLPILFVVEDNNLAILTEKKVRRSWSVAEVARGFGLEADDVPDDPEELRLALRGVFSHPRLLNVHTHRKYWHAGAGVDDPNIFDRHLEVYIKFEESYVMNVQLKILQLMEEAWTRHCEK